MGSKQSKSKCNCNYSTKHHDQHKIFEMKNRIKELNTLIKESVDIHDLAFVGSAITKLFPKTSLHNSIFESSNTMFEKNQNIGKNKKSGIINNAMFVMKSEKINANLEEIQFLESKITFMNNGCCDHCATMMSIELANM